MEAAGPEAVERQQFVSELFHALSQPLTALRCSLELALYDRSGSGPSRENLSLALAHAEQIARLATGIRELLEAEDPGDERVVVSLASCLHGAVVDLQPVAEAAQVQLLLHCDGVCPVRAELRRLRQALFYLLEFGVISSAAEKTARLQMAEEGADAVLRFTVTRSVGASAANPAPSAHEEQEQKSRELNRRLGLAIAGRIFEAAGGKLQVREENQQIQLRLRMPLAPSQGAASSA